MSACLKRVLVTHRTESVCFVVNKQFFFSCTVIFLLQVELLGTVLLSLLFFTVLKWSLFHIPGPLLQSLSLFYLLMYRFKNLELQ